MSFNRRSSEDQCRQAVEKKSAARRAIDAQILQDAERLITERFILALLLAAFLVRLAVRIAFGEEYFWTSGYRFYYHMAENFVSCKGFCFGTTRPPLYPMFLALSILAGENWLLIVVPQALIGSGTALCAFLIGREIFNPTVGAIACAITAFYPYYVMHDTALQETGMATFCIAISVWLLLRANRLDRNFDWFLSGLALGSVALVRISVTPIAAVAVLWTVIWGAQGHAWKRLWKSSILLFAVMLMALPWLAWTYHVTGEPVLSTEVGYALWAGNNPETFSHYPVESIDRSTEEALLKMAESDEAALARLADDKVAESNWLAWHAWAFIRANPWLTVRGAIRKIGAGFSPQLNPVRNPFVETVYAITYVPVALLGIYGMYLARRQRATILVALMFLAFMCVTAVFFAHTSHRSYLDLYWIVFAASVVSTFIGVPSEKFTAIGRASLS